VLDDITLYWLTNTGASSSRLYWENAGRAVTIAGAQKTADILLPVAITVFPDEIYRVPESWARRAYRNLIYFHEVDKGGHFAAWEQPELFATELRAAFKAVRQPNDGAHGRRLSDAKRNPRRRVCSSRFRHPPMNLLGTRARPRYASAITTATDVVAAIGSSAATASIPSLGTDRRRS
jgi:hypothetical protein